jgi:dTMP kinase
MTHHGVTSHNAAGRFITFEGGEGSGKSTQIRLLAEALQKRGIAVTVTREPGGSAMGEQIRALLLDPAAQLDPVTQLFLFSAARRDHVTALIAPALECGEWVLCDRFADSSRAYQGAAGAVPSALIDQCQAAAVGGTQPDLTIILDIDPEKGLARAARRRAGHGDADAFEASDLAFHGKVRAGFLAIAGAEPARCAVVDADRAQEAIHVDIMTLCEQRLRLDLKGARSA